MSCLGFVFNASSLMWPKTESMVQNSPYFFQKKSVGVDSETKANTSMSEQECLP